MPAITNVNELQAMENDLAGTYWLANDIDAAATSGWNAGAGFVPIGQGAPNFTGSLDSRGHVISDLFINRPATNYIGLFGLLATGAVLTDVVLTNVDIVGDDYVGALAGFALGTSTTISDCYSTGSVTATDDSVGGLIGCVVSTGISITNSYSTATITAGVGGSYVGGLIGYIGGDGIITDCYATGNVTAGGFRLGGFAGQITAGSFAISRCYATGNVESTTPVDYVGGFVGYLSETVTVTINDCYARGSAIGDTLIGGFVGQVLSGMIEDCYSTGAPSGNANVGGFCGENNGTITDCFWDIATSGQAASDGGTGKTTTEMKTRTTFTYAGWDFILIWGIDGITNDGYPFLGPEAPPDSPRQTVAVSDKITLESIRNIEMVAMGRFRVGQEGEAIYRSRYARNAEACISVFNANELKTFTLEISDREIYNDIRSEVDITEDAEVTGDGTPAEYQEIEVGVQWSPIAYVAANSHIDVTFTAQSGHTHITWLRSLIDYARRVTEHGLSEAECEAGDGTWYPPSGGYPSVCYYSEIGGTIKITFLTRGETTATARVTNPYNYEIYAYPKAIYQYLAQEAIAGLVTIETEIRTLRVRSTDAVSIRKYGRRVMDLVWPLGITQTTMQSIVDSYCERYSEPVSMAEMTLEGSTDTKITQILGMDIDDKHQIIHPGLDMDEEFFVNNVNYMFNREGTGILSETFSLEQIRAMEKLTLFIIGTSLIGGAHVIAP